MTFSGAETAACCRLVDWALEEDLGPLQQPAQRRVGDLTCQAAIPPDLRGQAVFVARSAGVLAGLPAATLVLQAVDSQLQFLPLMEDGARVEPGTRLATVAGRMESILIAERTILNFLQHLSGIATATRRYVDAIAGLSCRILDTRKTLPGWRLLQKYAVRCGGGQNHRLGLHDGILIKDNHLAALQEGLEAVPAAIRAAQEQAGRVVSVEIEVDTLDQLDRALACQPDIVLLDNMSLEQLRQAVQRRAERAPGVLLEASGGVTLASVRPIAETGVDRISVGALTHSVQALDIALDYLNK